jgi:DNA repair protein RecN (Recombination protein N)
VYVELKDSDTPIIQQLRSLQHKMKSLQEYHPEIEMLTQRLQSATLEIQDVADELERIDDSVHFDPERIEIINERISLGYKLLKKHNVTSTADLLIIQDNLQQKLDAVLNISSSIERLEVEVKTMQDACGKIASDISAKRSAQINSFTSKVNKLLVQVGMPNAQLKVQLTPAPLTVHGTDEIDFLFDANKSNRFEPVSKVASGGELSRLMLSIKSLVARKLELPTLIFDEIDTGISGEAAKQVGIIMKDLSEAHQLIAITHQPQIAARATAHFFVFKDIKADKIVTSVRRLDNDERITTIAKMLSGEKPTAAALENAREMVGN